MWQQFLSARTSTTAFSFLSVAVDVDRERVRPFAADLPFPTVVDSAGQLGRLFDFDVVPNGVFVDERGIIRFLHIGGFDIHRPEVGPQVDALLATDFTTGHDAPAMRQETLEVEVLRVELAAQPLNSSLHVALGEALMRESRLPEAEAAMRRATELDDTDWAARFALGTVLYQQHQTAAALTNWRAALVLDPPNFTVRKQIWMIEQPEKFYPTIDFDWQKEQLRLEGYTR